MRSPHYIRRGGIDLQPAPWQCDDVEAYVFYIKADLEALQQLCDRCLNSVAPQPSRFVPALPIVVLTFQRLDRMRSIAEGNRGAFSYCEAAFWVLVRELIGEDIEVLVPYIFAGNWLAVAAGREVYGYPKELANVSIPPRDRPDEFRITGLGLRAGHANLECNTEILRCSGIPCSARSLKELLDRDLWADIRRADPTRSPLKRVKDLIRLMTKRGLDFVFLRQIAAVEGGAACDLQQIVRASARPFRIKRLCLLRRDYRLILPPLESHPIGADLGLQIRDGNAVDVLMGVRFDLGFTLQPGKVILRA